MLPVSWWIEDSLSEFEYLGDAVGFIGGLAIEDNAQIHMIRISDNRHEQSGENGSQHEGANETYDERELPKHDSHQKDKQRQPNDEF